MATLFGIVGLLFILWQFARGELKDAQRKKREAQEQAQTQKALRDLESDVQAARGVAKEKARDVEKDLQERKASDARPAVFGDSRLHDRP